MSGSRGTRDDGTQALPTEPVPSSSPSEGPRSLPPSSPSETPRSAPPSPPSGATEALPGSSPPGATEALPGSSPLEATEALPGSSPLEATEALPGSSPPEATEALPGSSPPEATEALSPSFHTEIGERAAALRRDRRGGRRVVGVYEIRGFLGQGGMGRVYEAFDLELRRSVALKELAAELAQDEDFLRAFRREARLAARLKHPHVCQIWTAGSAEDSGLPYFAMEFVRGEDLGRRVRRVGPLPPGRAVALAMQAAAGLAHAHAQGLVHRDVKPANLLVDEEGLLRVGDFGLARSLEAASQETRSRIAMATPAYASPEAIRGEGTDHRTDMYGLGATLFFLLTGRAPYVAETTGDVLQAHVHAAIPDPRHLREGCPADLAALVMRLLAKHPDDRFPSWDAVENALREIAAALPTEDTAPCRLEPSRSRPSSRRTERDRSGATPGAEGTERSGSTPGAGGTERSGATPGVGGTQRPGTTPGTDVERSPLRRLATRCSVRRRARLKLVLVPLVAFSAWLGLCSRPGMVFVPGGDYLVGSPDAPRLVRLSPFWMERVEVTEAGFARALGRASVPSGRRPKVFASSDEVAAYCRATGLSVPTVEQWQAAARGPSGQAFPWGIDLPPRVDAKVASFDDDDIDASFRFDERLEAHGEGLPFPVGMHPFDRSPAGCLDMAGNLAECVREEGNEASVRYCMGASIRQGLTRKSCAEPGRNDTKRLGWGRDAGLRCVADGWLTRISDGFRLAVTILLALAVALLL